MLIFTKIEDTFGMERNLYPKLLSWKQALDRKPLILRGARQVGKTHLIKSFGAREYESVAYLNFEDDRNLHHFFESSLKPERILDKLRIYLDTPIEERKTLLIFDEIQECAAALNSLKYFCENAPEFHVVSAGSLLGIKMANEKGFPVGKVNFADLYPMTFFEFLKAIGKGTLANFLENIRLFQPIPKPFHEEALGLLKKYFFVGGMPEAVSKYIRTQSMPDVRVVHKEILDAYELDFAKHAPSQQVTKISLTWQSIPNQLSKENKKFIFTAVRKSARGRDYEDALQWLADAGIILRSFHISTPRIPLGGYMDSNAFKVFLLDVGLLAAQSRVPQQAILEPHQLFTEFKGALTENFVAQELKAKQQPLFYWTSEGTAEVDFVVEEESKIFPLEVKSGLSKHKKSLVAYDEKYHPSHLSRVSPVNLEQNGRVSNFPLYLIALFPELLR